MSQEKGLKKDFTNSKSKTRGTQAVTNKPLQTSSNTKLGQTIHHVSNIQSQPNLVLKNTQYKKYGTVDNKVLLNFFPQLPSSQVTLQENCIFFKQDVFPKPACIFL